MAPAIDTVRLALVGHRREDFEDCAALWGDPHVTRYIGGTPSTREEVWARLLRYVGHWHVMGYGYWVIRERATGRFVGEVGFADHHRELGPGFDRSPEAGWALASWAHGRGFATEAVRAAIAWLGASRSVCMVSPENVASLGVARKCGYREYARTTYKGELTALFERD